MPDDLPPAIREATRVSLGVAFGALDGAAGLLGLPEPDDAARAVTDRRRAVVVGALLDAQERSVRAAALLGRAVGPWASWAWRNPLVAPVRRRVEEHVDALATRGDAAISDAAVHLRETDLVVGTVRAVATPVLDDLLPLVIDRLAARPDLIEQVVDAVLDPLIDEVLAMAVDRLEAQPVYVERIVTAAVEPVIDAALPVALDALAADPDAIGDLVRAQSGSMAGDMAIAVRTRAVSGDALVERIARRLTFRRPLPAPTGPQALPPGAPAGPTADPSASEDRTS